MSEQNFSDQAIVESMAELTQPAVGQQLRAAREALGLEGIDIAQTLKLGPRQVEALENGDWQGLPGNTFVRGFVRNYARLVQIDPAPLMSQLDGLLAKPADTLVGQESRPAQMPRAGAPAGRDRAVVIAGAGLVALAALVYFLLPNDLSALRESTQTLLDSFGRKADAPPATLPAPVATTTEPVLPPGATLQQVMNPQAVAPGEVPPPVEKIDPAKPLLPVSDAPGATKDTVSGVKAPQMRFVFDKESWLEVRDRDNKQIFSQRLAAGTEQTLAGQGPLSVIIGYAPGVRVFWQGQAIDLTPHTRGDVARLVLE